MKKGGREREKVRSQAREHVKGGECITATEEGERVQHLKWKRGGVEEGRGGEKLEEEAFCRGKSGKHFPLFVKEGGNSERERHEFGSVSFQACWKKREGFLLLLKNRNAFVRSPSY